MNQLVRIEDGCPVTDGLTVAETFEKQHFHVLRDIENLECNKEFRESNFGLSSYKTAGADQMKRVIHATVLMKGRDHLPIVQQQKELHRAAHFALKVVK